MQCMFNDNHSCLISHNAQQICIFFNISQQLLVPFQAAEDENIDVWLENLDRTNHQRLRNEDFGGFDRRSVLHVEHR